MLRSGILPLTGVVAVLFLLLGPLRSLGTALVTDLFAPSERPVAAAPAPVIEPAAGPETPAPAVKAAPLQLDALEEVDAALRKRQAELDERQKQLDATAAVLNATKAQVEADLTRAEKMRDETAAMLGQGSAEDEARRAQLVKVYETMKPKKAAVIFDTLDMADLLPIVRSMREARVAAIVALMDPAKARLLTMQLGRGRPAMAQVTN